LPLSTVQLQNAASRNPDLIASFDFDAEASSGGVPGIEYRSSGASGRVMHGSFSPRGVHNVLIGSGPAFGPDLHRDGLLTANTDAAPTIAAILGLKLPSADGRMLNEMRSNARGRPELQHAETLRPGAEAEGSADDGGQVSSDGGGDAGGNRIDAPHTQAPVRLWSRTLDGPVAQEAVGGGVGDARLLIVDAANAPEPRSRALSSRADVSIAQWTAPGLRLPIICT